MARISQWIGHMHDRVMEWRDCDSHNSWTSFSAKMTCGNRVCFGEVYESIIVRRRTQCRRTVLTGERSCRLICRLAFSTKLSSKLRTWLQSDWVVDWLVDWFADLQIELRTKYCLTGFFVELAVGTKLRMMSVTDKWVSLAERWTGNIGKGLGRFKMVWNLNFGMTRIILAELYLPMRLLALNFPIIRMIIEWSLKVIHSTYLG